MKQRHVFIFMGVSGSGKSAVARQVAFDLNAANLDGDFLHPKNNILKMRQGIPLNDEDREPWLKLVNNAAFAMSNVNPISIITCSALKLKYRNIIRAENNNVHFIYLKGTFSLIEQRLQQRQGHYQKTGMLQSQFDTLEEPTTEDDIITIDIDQPLEQVIIEAKNAILAVCNK